MKILNLSVKGFSNVESFDLELNKFNALLGLNNYGKSNALNGIIFAFDFIQSPVKQKSDMMAYRPFVPANIHIENRPFEFEFSFELGSRDELLQVEYGFSFEWIKNNNKGKVLRSENLKIKKVHDLKFTQIFSRKNGKALYATSKSGRADKSLSVKENELAVNKLMNFDDLYYLPVLTAINEAKIIEVDTLQHPDRLFGRVLGDVVRTGYSLALPKEEDIGFFIYSLYELDKNRYSMFEDAVMTLLPDIEKFVPNELDFKELREEGKVKIPVSFPEKFYDVRIREFNYNQDSTIQRLSSGSQKLIFVLAMAVAADINKVPLIVCEELENSIHPGLLQKMLQVLDALLESTKVMLSSHSPYLLQYLDVDRISIGLPNAKGLAEFKKIKNKKVKKAMNMAASQGMNLGDLIFDEMINCTRGSSELLNEFCG